jgi:hypothetical protein
MDQNRRADRIPFVIDGELPVADRKLTLRHGRHPTDALRTGAFLLWAPHAPVIASATRRSSQGPELLCRGRCLPAMAAASRVAVRAAALDPLREPGRRRRGYRFDAIVSNEPASTRLLLVAMSGAPKH